MKPLRLAITQKVYKFLPPIFAQRLRHLLYPFDQAQRDDYEFIVRALTGSMFKNRTGDFHAYPFSIHGFYEWRNWAIALALCSPGDAIIEVGANVGTETVGFADIVGDLGKVYVFEPLPSNYLALIETLRLNQHRHVVVFPFALADECKRVHFSIPSTKSTSGMGCILGPSQQSISTSIEVDCVTLDSLSDCIGLVKMLFIDAEGAEVVIITGARDTIRRDKPSIVLEAASKLLALAGFSLHDLYSGIRNLDYQVFKVSRLGLAKVELENTPEKCNWLCVHSSKLDAVKVVRKSLKMCGLLPCIPGLNPLIQRPRQ